MLERRRNILIKGDINIGNCKNRGGRGERERDRGTGVLSLDRERCILLNRGWLYIQESPMARKLAVGFKMHNGEFEKHRYQSL